MTGTALLLLVVGGLALLLGCRSGRPALIFLGAGIIASHAIPLAFLDLETVSATLRAQIDQVAAIALIASLAWCAGYWVFARSKAVVPQVSQPKASAPPHRVHIATLIALTGLIAAAPGGLIGFAQTGFLRLPVDSFLFSVTYAAAVLAAFTTALISVNAAASRQPTPWLSTALVLLAFWLLGGRTQFAITGIGFCLVYLAHGRVRLRTLVLPGVAAGVLAALTLSFRLTLQGTETGLSEALPLMIKQMSLLDGYALSARYVDEFGFAGWHYWDTLQQIFPRALFPEKPLQLSKALRLMETRDTLGGLTPGLAGEAFAAGGLVGVAGIGLAFGSALALFDNAYRRLREMTPMVQAVVVCLLPVLAIFVLRGGFDTAIFRIVVVLGAFAFGSFWQATHRDIRVASAYP